MDEKRPCTHRPTPRLQGKRDHAAMERRRLEALSLLADGISQAEVARQVGVSRQAVSKWVAARRRGGEKALASKGKPGRKTGPTPSEMQQVKAVLDQGPDGGGSGRWTLREIAEAIGRVTRRPRPSISRTWRLMR